MRVDFYQLSRDPAPQVAARLACKAHAAGMRVLIVDGDDERREEISRAIWSLGGAEGFPANGEASMAGAARQPILLAPQCDRANAATIALVADGAWREGLETFERVLLLFDESQTEAARALWRRFDDDASVEREIYKQDEAGRWRAGA